MEEFLFRIETLTTDTTGHRVLSIDGEEHFHLCRVLRFKVGDQVLATDGMGTAFLCAIMSMNQKRTLCRVISTIENLNAGLRNYRIGIAMLKPFSKVELALEKCTEIGAESFIVFNCERSGKSLPRLDRLNSILRSATKQSLQSRVPRVEFRNSVEDLVSSNLFSRRIVLHEKSDQDAAEFLTVIGRREPVVALIGPEGGFTDSEVSFLKKNAFVELSLGKSRLRSETAAIKIASLLSVYF